jgi:hypothetical protein
VSIGTKTRAKLLGRQRIADGEVRPFRIPACRRCGAWLCDSTGEPRWDVEWPLRFVCLGGCPRPYVRRKAGLS